MKGYINSIETMGLVDGPGIRVVVFFEGCPLRCCFCHNPETWFINKDNGISARELVDNILKYKSYFGNEGGVTFSGGEPLQQHDFLLECLRLCKLEGINTCLDTSGYGFNYDDILELVDLVLWDVKALDNKQYNNITGKDIDVSFEFLNKCQKLNKRMWIRQVIIPGINDTSEYIKKLKNFIKKLKNIERIELLPYHLLGVSKYEKLGIPYKLKDVSSMDVQLCDKLYEELISDN